MRQLLHVGGSACRARHVRVVCIVCLALALPLLAGCGINDILGRKPTATVPAALLATPAKTTTTAAVMAQPTAAPTNTQPVAANTAAAGVTPAAQATAATQPTVAGQGTYTVVQGDTLSGIASQFGITTEELIAANSLTDPDKLSIGQTLVIPAPGSVTTAPPQTEATQPQQQQAGGSPELVQFGQDIQLEQIGSWLGALGPMITTMSANPSSICTSAEFDAAIQQGQTLIGSINGASAPAGMADLQAQLGSGIQGINDGLAGIKRSMCEMNDSVAATTGLLQLSLSLAQVQATVDAIGQSIEQGVSG